jgi:hypothetical protein
MTVILVTLNFLFIENFKLPYVVYLIYFFRLPTMKGEASSAANVHT